MYIGMQNSIRIEKINVDHCRQVHDEEPERRAMFSLHSNINIVVSDNLNRYHRQKTAIEPLASQTGIPVMQAHIILC